MTNNKDLSKYKIRTDLVIDDINNLNDNIIVKIKKHHNVEVLNVKLIKDNSDINKKKGSYITISFNDITDTRNKKNVEKILVKELKGLIKKLGITKDDSCLVVGLGNINSTPDALGPKVIDKVMVTRYLYEIEKIEPDPNYRNVATFVPGVTGNTGIESSDVIMSIINSIKPSFIIVIDALASNGIDRLNKTIQLTDTGISPGSGVNNTRKEISKYVLNIPVISIGMPTVIDVNTIINESISNIESVNINNYNMMVTTKEIDFIIEKASSLIANSINKALHVKFDI